MSKDKLQVCVSFKHTKEEKDLYVYTIAQGDKSMFIKNLIRAYREGRVLDTPIQHTQVSIQDFVNDEKPPKTNIINNGKKTRSKFLA